MAVLQIDTRAGRSRLEQERPAGRRRVVIVEAPATVRAHPAGKHEVDRG